MIKNIFEITIKLKLESNQKLLKCVLGIKIMIFFSKVLKFSIPPLKIVNYHDSYDYARDYSVRSNNCYYYLNSNTCQVCHANRVVATS